MSLAAFCIESRIFAQLVELDLAVDVGLHVGDVALQPAREMAERARHARQLLGPITISATRPMTSSSRIRCRTWWA